MSQKCLVLGVKFRKSLQVSTLFYSLSCTFTRQQLCRYRCYVSMVELNQMGRMHQIGIGGKRVEKRKFMGCRVWEVPRLHFWICSRMNMGCNVALNLASLEQNVVTSRIFVTSCRTFWSCLSWHVSQFFPPLSVSSSLLLPDYHPFTPVLVFVLDATSVASTKSIKARKTCIVFNICQFIIFLVVLVVFINLSQEGHHLDVQDLIRSSPASILDSWFLLDGDWSEFLEQGPICVNTFKFQTTKLCRSMCICHKVIHDLEVTASSFPAGNMIFQCQELYRC